MKRTIQKILAIFLAIFLVLSFGATAFTADKATLDKAVSEAAAYLLKTVKNPEVGSVGGEWTIIGLARSGYDVPDSYYENYYITVEKYISDKNGVLHDRKYTEFCRMILSLTATGYDPRDVAGYDLTEPLGDIEQTIWQGVNGPIFALIALDSLDYPMPENKGAKTQATRDLYVAEIIRRQLPDGGWNLTAGAAGAIGPNEKGDPDITGMALQALAKYQGKKEVKDATDRALTFLSDLQDEKGGYASWGDVNTESVVQVLIALCALGVPVDDPRFVKNDKTLVDNILSFKNADGSFHHSSDNSSGNSQMSCEQALCGLVAAQRAAEGKNSLYRMSDAMRRDNFITTPTEPGLPGKRPDVKSVSVTVPGKTFPDVKNHANQPAIEALAARGVINGKSPEKFDPDATMIRAEYAAIVTRGLGLPEKTVNMFSDVPMTAWYVNSIATAYFYEIVNGVGNGKFNPDGPITRQEAAVMTARAAALCGMDVARADAAIRDTLAQFGDYRTVSSWAQSALAFCYDVGILDDSVFNIEPNKAIKRCEVAEMLYRMLGKANLL